MPEPTVEAGHARMLGLLEEIAGQAADEHLILGDRRARVLRRQLDELKADTARDAPAMSISVSMGNWGGSSCGWVISARRLSTVPWPTAD